MKKVALFSALAAAAVPAYAGEATIGGRIFASIEHERRADGTSSTDITDGNSRLWIMGKEDLGNGLSLNYGLNSFVAHDYNGWATDDSYIGIKGSFGRLRVGRISTPLHYMTGYQDIFNGNNYTQALRRMTRFGNRALAVNYDSPAYGGLSYRLQFAPGANRAGRKNANWMAGFGIDYTHPKGYNAHYAVEYAPHDSPDKTKNRQVHSMTVGYDVDKLYLAAGFMFAKNVADKFHWSDEAANNTHTRDFQVSARYTFGAVSPSLGVAYGRSGTGKNYKQLAFNTEYSFSKRTTLAFNSGVVKESKDPKNAWAVGFSMQHNLQ